MKLRTRWLHVVAGLAVTLVAVSAVVQAVRQGSWSPLISVSWLFGVIAATWPGAAGRWCCRPRRRPVSSATSAE